jgi:predicted nucleotidyltransferase
MPKRSSSSSGAVFLDRQQAVEEVRQAVRRLAADRPGVIEVWLFGSLARGDATPRSDADLLIVVDRDDRRPMDRAPEFLRLLVGVGRPVDVIVATAEEWRAREGSRFHTEIQTRGLRLHP